MPKIIIPPETVTVIPSPSLPPTCYVRGVPAAGRIMPISEARPLLDAGLVIIRPDDPPAQEDD